MTTVVKEEGMSFIIDQGCETVCSGRCAGCRRYKGTYCLNFTLVMEAYAPPILGVLISPYPDLLPDIIGRNC